MYFAFVGFPVRVAKADVFWLAQEHWVPGNSELELVEN